MTKPLRKGMPDKYLPEGFSHPKFPHGGENAYYCYGCRCSICVTSIKEKTRRKSTKEARSRMPVKFLPLGISHPDFPHGKRRGRELGCDCSRCVEAVRAAELLRRRRRKGIQCDDVTKDLRSPEHGGNVSHPKFPHGTKTGCVYYKCKCAECREWYLADNRKNNRRMPYKFLPLGFSHPDFPHGKIRGVNLGCKCKLCITLRNNTARDRWRWAHKFKERGFDCNSDKDFRLTGTISAIKAKARNAKRLNSRIKSEMPLLRKIVTNTPVGFEVDHIIPIAAGGSHTVANLQYLPKYWNIIKRDNINSIAERFAIPWEFFVLDNTEIIKIINTYWLLSSTSAPRLLPT